MLRERLNFDCLKGIYQRAVHLQAGNSQVTTKRRQQILQIATENCRGDFVEEYWTVE